MFNFSSNSCLDFTVNFFAEVAFRNNWKSKLSLFKYFTKKFSFVQFKFVFFFRDPLEDLFDPFNIRHWTLRNTGPFLQDSKLSSRETKDSDKDREPLAPDYKDPIPGASEDKPSVEKKPNGFDPSVLPGGVIDVDAGGSGLPSAFPNVHNFGFSSSFGGNGGGLFGLGGFFGGALPEIKPWWKG